MIGFHYRCGAALALVSAGPAFILLLLVAAVVISPQEGETVAALIGALPAAIISIPFGAILGAIPIMVGGLLMGNLGVVSRASRHPLPWAAAGGSMALPMPVLLNIGTEWGLYGLFALTGAICALIVRYGTRWSDDSV